ncbi:MAG: Nif3-like dinuclear metal center hexameric protein [Oscillospiraceae bacterium]|nr:Nif3-like dinuclear metal center hexameric protein [Oscillospiraceae bacterium]
MKIQDVVDKILAYHPEIPDDKPGACDGFKCGNPGDDCTGIATSVAPSVDVIRRTAELGANLLIVHEPAFYTHLDKTEWLAGNEVFKEKKAILDKHGIAIWRDHDHIHSHKPDGIFHGNMMELGWQDYLVGEERFERYFRLPKTTVRALALFLKEKIGLNGVRVIGNIDAEVSTVAFVGHIYPPTPEERATTFANDKDIDVLIPGELIDWTTASYMRDAGQLGKNKAILHIGHMSMEELGMKWAVNWIGDLISHELPVTFVRSADMYQYV